MTWLLLFDMYLSFFSFRATLHEVGSRTEMLKQCFTNILFDPQIYVRPSYKAAHLKYKQIWPQGSPDIRFAPPEALMLQTKITHISITLLWRLLLTHRSCFIYKFDSDKAQVKFPLHVFTFDIIDLLSLKLPCF